MSRLCLKRWKKSAFLLVAALCIYFLVNPSINHEISQSVNLKNKTPESAWHYVSDVNNLKNSYPNIVDIDIISDNNRNDVWEYSADIHWLTSQFGKVPVLAEFNVKPGKGFYDIVIQAKACKYYILCAISHNTLRFEWLDQNNRNCLLTHHGTLTVPRILNWMIADLAQSEWRNWLQMIKSALE